MTEAPRRRLGRGLEALLGPVTVAAARVEGSLAELPVDAIEPNPFQPRRAFDDGALAELVDSMRTNGLLQPVVVRPSENQHYQLIAGERRWRAAQQLGWRRLPAIVREVDDRTLLTLALVENLQRDALSPMDEARGYHRLIDEFGVSQTEVADVVGKDRTTIVNALRLLKLPPAVQEMVHRGVLSAGHARALLGIPGDGQTLEHLARDVVQKGLTVRDVEALARRRRGARRTSKSHHARSPEIRAVEDALRRRLQTDVRVRIRGKASGRLTVNFYSNDDLARILEIILGEPYEG